MDFDYWRTTKSDLDEPMGFSEFSALIDLIDAERCDTSNTHSTSNQ